ncbi:putative vancomycin resistance protein [Thermobacillus composti KWC4]|uniref:Putative vancomycin resistance protein n=2 Tax=Thermobacillus TaxID=76632 RepID=L0EJJ8_THECK|nr:putative vancomycin resistance protein [Thermobacillus composti KWC4]
MKWMMLAGLIALLSPDLPDGADGALTIRLPGETIRIHRGEFALPGTGFVDPARLDRLADGLAAKVDVPARNAKFAANGTIRPEQPGRKLDREAFESQFYAYFYGSGEADMEPPARQVPAKVDSALLAGLNEKVIGRYVTYYNPRNRNRSHNIELASAALDSTVVFPGETFSFNRTIGKRTVERGYRQAPVIVRGELSEGVGGGICQVSSTLFNAVDNAGLEIVERYAHSRHVAYVPPGRDATVSWYGPDFAFRNTLNQPVLIRAYAARGTMRVVLYSTESVRHHPRKVPGIQRGQIEEVRDALHPDAG